MQMQTSLRVKHQKCNFSRFNGLILTLYLIYCVIKHFLDYFYLLVYGGCGSREGRQGSTGPPWTRLSGPHALIQIDSQDSVKSRGQRRQGIGVAAVALRWRRSPECAPLHGIDWKLGIGRGGQGEAHRGDW